MLESKEPGDLITTLKIFGTTDQIQTQLAYNSAVVKTNGTDYFSLNFTSLYLRYTLDYEWWTANGYPNPFRIIVLCTIKANQSVHDLDFQMDLIDVNDNAPKFNQSVYSLDVLETAAVNSTIYSGISAYDLDSGIGGTFVYYLTNDSQYSSYFRLATPTNASLILLKPLDYNQMASRFNLTIMAQDNGVPSLSSQTTVSIRLIDVDNLNPAFRSSSYNLNISIDTPASSVVIPNEGSVNAYDQDIGINATILYSMTANTYLIISKTTGTITLQRNFSFPTRFDLLLKVTKTNVRQFQVQTENPTDLPLCAPCTCQFNVTDGLNTDSTEITVITFVLPVFSKSSYLFSADYPLNATSIGTVQTVTDGRCQVQYTIVNLDNSSMINQLFTINSLGSLRYSSTSLPTREAYQMRVNVLQLCLNSSTTSMSNADITVTVKNFLSTNTQSQIIATKTDQSTLYAVIASVIGFVFIVLASMIIIIYYKIQRARRRVPPFFKQKSRSQAQGLFFKSKTPLGDQQTSPYTLDVRDDDSNSITPRLSPDSGIFHHSSSNVENGHQRLLSGHYKVSEPPMLSSSHSSHHHHTNRTPTLEDLLSTYDNRSSTSESSSSAETPTIAHRPGSFRTTLSIREPDFNFNDNHHQQHQLPTSTILDTINEDTAWEQQNNQHHRSYRPLRPAEDSMDIISESHEVANTNNSLSTKTVSPSSSCSSPSSTKQLLLSTTTTNTKQILIFDNALFNNSEHLAATRC
ncbi:unnamed protein product [Didymodactylos carnosus]|uniref:Cadherin domain-containing protein n=2 Tax=Didymodactylos carnosus TaxID=1234261 RepID=A0A814FPI4_9BILA|nr:unnamed protein product [Didymodactylos carnosus]CAF3758019.1 unnamed protein product [Didymodactylos carnosus]